MKLASPKMDRWLWTLVFIVIAGAVSVDRCFQAASLLVRLVGWLAAGVLLVWVFLKTMVGQKFSRQWLDSVQEVRKMHWSTRQETLHTTGAVLLMVFVMSLLLCSADAVLLRAVKWLMTGHWGV